MSADLCGPLNLDKSSISRVVKKLVEAGEVEEEFDGGTAGKGDGRVKRLVLTAKGKETVKAIDVSVLILTSEVASIRFQHFISCQCPTSGQTFVSHNVIFEFTTYLFVNVRLCKSIQLCHDVPS